MVAALPGATGPDATGKVERERLIAVADQLGIPVLDLTARLASVERQGYRLYLPNSVRLSGAGHTLAAGYIWSFLVDNHLLPAGLVPARVAGSGHAIPDLASLPRALGDTLWASRHDLIGRFIQLGLLAVCVVWLSAPLSAAARDWVLAGLGAAMLWLLGTRDAAAIGVALAIACYGAVELLPPLPATVATTALLAGFVALTARAHAVHAPGESCQVPVLLAAASSVALVKLISYAADRRRGAARLPLRAFLASMLFFPTLPAGPVEPPVTFAARRAAGAVAPAPAAGAAAIARLALGWLQFTLAPAFLALDNTDVFATRGDAFGRMRLWLFVAEVALLFTLLLAGWSNVAIGLGRLAGETPPENLRRPWLAPSVVEFWRRWHASLATWLRDYVYVPLGGGRRATLRNVAVTFLVAAGWYGWTITKILGYGGYPPRAWRRLLLCALFNAGAVAACTCSAAGPATPAHRARSAPRGASGRRRCSCRSRGFRWCCRCGTGCRTWPPSTCGCSSSAERRPGSHTARATNAASPHTAHGTTSSARRASRPDQPGRTNSSFGPGFTNGFVIRLSRSTHSPMTFGGRRSFG